MKTRMDLWKSYRDEIKKNIILKEALQSSNLQLNLLYKRLNAIFPNYENIFGKKKIKNGLKIEDIENNEKMKIGYLSDILNKIRNLELNDDKSSFMNEINFSSEDMEEIFQKLNKNKNDSVWENTNPIIKSKIETKFLNLQKGGKMEKINIAIDGPSGSGKTTVARKLAERLNYKYISTGLVYRAIALYIIKKNIDYSNANLLKNVLKEGMIELLDNEVVLLNGENVTVDVRSDNVSKLSSIISAYPFVRKYALKIQKSYGEEKGVIMDGRDTTFNVMPHAELKVFLDTNPELRAKRRQKQNEELGFQTDYETILKEIKERDYNDRNRAIDPLHKTKDAISLNSSNMEIDEVVKVLLEEVHKVMK